MGGSLPAGGSGGVGEAFCPEEGDRARADGAGRVAAEGDQGWPGGVLRVQRGRDRDDVSAGPAGHVPRTTPARRPRPPRERSRPRRQQTKTHRPPPENQTPPPVTRRQPAPTRAAARRSRKSPPAGGAPARTRASALRAPHTRARPWVRAPRRSRARHPGCRISTTHQPRFDGRRHARV